MKQALLIGLLMTHSLYGLPQTYSLPKEHWMKLESFYAHKRVLVTGGCGFIGSHLAEKLVACDAQVTILDNLATGSEKNIEKFRNNIRLVQANVADPAVCDAVVQRNDIIFHLAAYISVPGSIRNPTLCHETNVNGTYHLLDAARRHHVSRFVFSSTSAVYGPKDGVCSETDTALNPISPYGATKLMGELYCKQFSLLFNVPCVILRYFNVYGPRQDPHSAYAAVVAKFEDCIKNNEPFTIFGDGLQTRDFIPVSQVVEANLVAGMADEAYVAGNVFNVGTGTSISVLELAHRMKNEHPSYQHEIRYAPARDGDVKHTTADCSRLKKLFQLNT